MLYSKFPIDAICVFNEKAVKIANVKSAAGNAILKFILNLSFISTPCVFVAAIVVSETKDRLSPNIAPPTMVPTHIGIPKPEPVATLTAMGTNTVMVPTLVPIAIEIKQAIKNNPGSANCAGKILSNKFAVLSAPPASFAIPLKAPATRKIKSIIVIFSSPIPFAQILIFSSKETVLFCNNATIRAITNATTTDII